MRLDGLAVFVTDHAHDQYNNRVEPMSRFELHKHCLQKLQQRNYHAHKEWLHLDGVWWIFNIEVDTLHLITCYGRSDMDLPRAMHWAACKRDRIVLDHLV